MKRLVYVPMFTQFKHKNFTVRHVIYTYVFITRKHRTFQKFMKITSDSTINLFLTISFRKPESSDKKFIDQCTVIFNLLFKLFFCYVHKHPKHSDLSLVTALHRTGKLRSSLDSEGILSLVRFLAIYCFIKLYFSNLFSPICSHQTYNREYSRRFLVTVQ